MATYYVRPDGNDTNAGTGSTVGTAWKTVQRALGASGITSGDTVYIAPGLYNEQITVGGTYSSTAYITGDPTASQFTGLTPGRVTIGAFLTESTAATYSGFTLKGTSTNNLYFSNLCFALAGTDSAATGGVSFITSRYITFDKCTFTQHTNSQHYLLYFSATTSTALDCIVKNCVFLSSRLTGVSYSVLYIGQNVATDTSAVTDCLFIGSTHGLYLPNVYITVANSTFISHATMAIQQGGGYTKLFNCIFYGCTSGPQFGGVSQAEQTFCRYIGCVATFSGVNSSATSSTVGTAGFEDGFSLLTNISPLQMFSTYLGSPNAAFGTSTNAPTRDMYNVLWTGVSPDAGSATYRSLSSVSNYLPTERNASVVTIAPGSTSQSIELYLGATGLVFNTSGLAAYYVRNQSAPVAITLVTQTATGAWTSGGFAEISSSLVPGVYRLDVPNAAFAAGASDVTIVVRGASGTNGAVLTVTLSSGGLTAAQTAAAVLDAVGSSYVTAGSIGYSIQNSNVASISGSTAAADELEGALLHNGTDYISAELVTPVTSAALVRMGPFEVKADGLGASDPLDIQTGAQHGIDIQCVDNNGAGIDITSATVTAKVYNSGATLVDTYACTATYAADGRATFTIDTTVTNTPGTYTATITRSTTANDTQVFGPLRVYVRDI